MMEPTCIEDHMTGRSKRQQGTDTGSGLLLTQRRHQRNSLKIAFVWRSWRRSPGRWLELVTNVTNEGNMGADSVWSVGLNKRVEDLC